MAGELARETGAPVLLKGVPTVIGSPDDAPLVSATGTPVLAAAGSGDVLGGIVATLLAQLGKLIESGELEKRLEALEGVLVARKVRP